MCEHKWTIVYLYETPVGVACETCNQAIALDPNSRAQATQPPRPAPYSQIDLTGDQVVRIASHGRMVGDFRVVSFQTQHEIRDPARVSVELVEEVPF